MAKLLEFPINMESCGATSFCTRTDELKKLFPRSASYIRENYNYSIIIILEEPKNVKIWKFCSIWAFCFQGKNYKIIVGVEKPPLHKSN